MSNVDLYTELALAFKRATDEKVKRRLEQLGLHCPLIGVANIQITGQTWEPHEEGTQHLVYPVLTGEHICTAGARHCHSHRDPAPRDVAGRELDVVDIVAWRTDRPGAYLRVGNVWALGEWMCYWTGEDDKDPLMLYETPTAWLKGKLPGAMIVDWDAAMPNMAPWTRVVCDKLDVAERFDTEFKKYKQRATPTSPKIQTLEMVK